MQLHIFELQFALHAQSGLNVINQLPAQFMLFS